MEKLNMGCTMWCLSSNALLMQVSDEGGGIPRSGLPKIFTHLYSTAKNPPDLDGPNEGATMAGYGFGLPISRLYARYFGGDLQIISMEGYGMFILHSVH
jgi:pyruvate dehydrogenase kinase 2/3/4